MINKKATIQFKFAFTLAEILVTLGVVGVIAAITIPNLLSAYKAFRLRSQFNKSYQLITNVAKYMQNDDLDLDALSSGPDGSYYWYGVYKIFKEYVKYNIDCGTTKKSEQSKYCYLKSGGANKGYKTLFGKSEITPDEISSGELILPDGTNLLFNRHVSVAVDLNGYANPPNRAGYDLFFFRWVDGTFLPDGFPGTLHSVEKKFYCCDLSKDIEHNGKSCAQKAATDNDYFKTIVKKVK